MSGNDVGLVLWNEDDGVIFDTADFSGRYVGSLNFTGPANGVFTAAGKPSASDLWIKVEYYNVTPDQFAQAIVIIINGNQINYNLSNLSSLCQTVIHYGFR